MSKSKLKTLYVYPDGHGVGVFEEYHGRSGVRVEWVEIFEKVFKGNIHVNCPDEDRDNYRLIFSNGLCGLVRKATHLTVYENNNTTNATNKGIHISSVTVNLKDGEFTVLDIQGLISGDFHYQGRSNVPTLTPETFEQAIEKRSWGFNDMNIVKVHKVEKDPTTV